MKIKEVRMKHLFSWCHNKRPMTLLSKDAELPLINDWGSEGYIVAIDTNDSPDEVKFSKLQTYIRGLNGYGVNFSFSFLRFSRGEKTFFYPAIAIYMKRNGEAAIEHFSTLEYYARRTMDFVSDTEGDFTNDYTLLKFEKGKCKRVPCDILTKGVA